MALQSMTGFSRQEGQGLNANWVWELRSVNGKSLDLRFRLPTGFDSLETQFKKIAAKHIARGNVQIQLQIERDGGGSVPSFNEKAFDAALEIAERAAKRSHLPMPGIESLLAVKGVIELTEEEVDEETVAKRQDLIIADFEVAIAALAKARLQEGEAIARVLTDQVGRIDDLLTAIKSDPSRSAEAIAARLSEQIAQLVDPTNTVDLQRVHQEAAILAVKADLQEEIDRLDAHISSARALLTEEGAVGRKLDFLAQEFNRECNTICSKSNAPAVTKAGLEMKVIIDQFREQIQNLQ